MSKTYHGTSMVFLRYMLKNMVYFKLHQYIFMKIKQFDLIAPKTKHKQLLYTICLTIITDASFIRCWRNVKIRRITFIIIRIILILLNQFIPLIYNTTVVHPKHPKLSIISRIRNSNQTTESVRPKLSSLGICSTGLFSSVKYIGSF